MQKLKAVPKLCWFESTFEPSPRARLPSTSTTPHTGCMRRLLPFSPRPSAHSHPRRSGCLQDTIYAMSKLTTALVHLQFVTFTPPAPSHPGSAHATPHRPKAGFQASVTAGEGCWHASYLSGLLVWTIWACGSTCLHLPHFVGYVTVLLTAVNRGSTIS